jgi:hypothetical protein
VPDFWKSWIPDTNLAQTGQSVNFSASYNMGADNLIFEWNIEGTVTNITSSNLTHVFTTAGIDIGPIIVNMHWIDSRLTWLDAFTYRL